MWQFPVDTNYGVRYLVLQKCIRIKNAFFFGRGDHCRQGGKRFQRDCPIPKQDQVYLRNSWEVLACLVLK